MIFEDWISKDDIHVSRAYFLTKVSISSLMARLSLVESIFRSPLIGLCLWQGRIWRHIRFMDENTSSFATLPLLLREMEAACVIV